MSDNTIRALVKAARAFADTLEAELSDDTPAMPEAPVARTQPARPPRPVYRPRREASPEEIAAADKVMRQRGFMVARGGR